MDIVAWTGVVLVALVATVWAGAWVVALVRDLGLTILAPLVLFAVLAWGVVGALWLIGRHVI